VAAHLDALPGRVAALAGEDLAKVLDQAGSYRPLFELVAFTGMRISEGLGSLWRDVDMEAGILRVEQQLTRYRTLGPLNTESSRREIELAPGLVRLTAAARPLAGLAIQGSR
jgi:integrase